MSFNKFLLKLTLAVGLVALTSAAPAVTLAQIDSQIDSIIAGSSSSVQWSVLIENEWGTQTYYSLNPTTQRRPASNTKIFTTAAAFEIYGPSHVWNGYQLGSSSNSSPVHSILTSSNNSLADSLFSHNGGQTASKNALSAAGIDMSGSVMLDGSGLSWNNRFNCRQTLDTVRFMMNKYNFNQWGTHLAVGCASGTLGSRFCGTVGSGNVFAKTGTLTNGQTLSLSGYIDNPNDGERYYFSIYCNSVPSQYQSGTRSRIDQIVNVMGQSAIPNPGPPSSAGDPDTIIDNASSGFSASSSWFTSTWVSGFYGTNYHARQTQSISDAASWSGSLPATGDYEVFARWTAGATRASNAAYIVHHTGGTTTVNVDQTQNNGQWVSLGNFNLSASNQLRVQLSCWTSSGDYVIADAVGFTPQEVIVDNTDPGFTASSSWFPSTSVSGYYGSNYHARATASTSDAATWKADLSSTGNYKVYARWTTGSNRATSAPFIVYHTGGSTVVNKNQQSNGGSWQLLGTFNLASGNSTRVALSCWTSSGPYVIADAIRIVPD